MPHLDSREPAWPLPTDHLPSGVLREVRVGRVVGDDRRATAYEKAVVTGPVQVGELVIDGDEQAATMHGGPDRVVLQCSPDHLSDWRRELPEHADLFVAGCLGENFVVDGMDEWNLCIGDVVSVGTCLLQVAQTRSPCYKLNAKFNRRDMSQLVQSSGRGGWLYRVLEPGTLQIGDQITVVDRPCPEWPLSRFNHHLYEADFDADIARELIELEPLAASMREKFRKRLASQEIESFASRLGIPE